MGCKASQFAGEAAEASRLQDAATNAYAQWEQQLTLVKGDLSNLAHRSELTRLRNIVDDARELARRKTKEFKAKYPRTRGDVESLEDAWLNEFEQVPEAAPAGDASKATPAGDASKATPAGDASKATPAGEAATDASKIRGRCLERSSTMHDLNKVHYTEIQRQRSLNKKKAAKEQISQYAAARKKAIAAFKTKVEEVKGYDKNRKIREKDRISSNLRNLQTRARGQERLINALEEENGMPSSTFGPLPEIPEEYKIQELSRRLATFQHDESPLTGVTCSLAALAVLLGIYVLYRFLRAWSKRNERASPMMNYRLS